VIAKRFTTCSPKAPDACTTWPQYHEMKIPPVPPPKRNAGHGLFDYLEAEKR